MHSKIKDPRRKQPASLPLKTTGLHFSTMSKLFAGHPSWNHKTDGRHIPFLMQGIFKSQYWNFITYSVFGRTGGWGRDRDFFWKSHQGPNHFLSSQSSNRESDDFCKNQKSHITSSKSCFSRSTFTGLGQTPMTRVVFLWRATSRSVTFSYGGSDPCLLLIIKHVTSTAARPSGPCPRTTELDPATLQAGKTDSCQSLWMFHIPMKALDNVAFVLHSLSCYRHDGWSSIAQSASLTSWAPATLRDA